MAEGWDRDFEKNKDEQDSGDASSSDESYHSADELDQQPGYISVLKPNDAREPEQASKDRVSGSIKLPETNEACAGAEAICKRESNQVDRSNTTAVPRRTKEANTFESSCVTEDEAITMSDSADGLSQSPSTYLACPYHENHKYLIDHYCKDHGCRVCKKCARQRYHKHCDIVGINVFMNTHRDLNVNVERKRHGYQICQYHDNNNYLIDHFCKDHSCLLCLTCARRKHSKCTVCSVIALSRDLNLKEEVNQFLRSIVHILRGTLLRLREKLERHMKVDLENEHQKTYNEAVNWFQSNTRKDASAERELDHITADLSWALKNEKRKLADHIKKIDDILKNFDSTYMKLESSESTYNNDSEKLFISIYNLVPDVNNCVQRLQEIQSKLYLANLKLQAVSGSNKIEKIEIQKRPLPEKPVQCFTFPNKCSPI